MIFLLFYFRYLFSTLFSVLQMILGEEADQQHQTVSISITKVHGLDRTSGKKREAVLQVVDRSC